MSEPRRFEWPTIATLLFCYALFALGSTWASAIWLPLGMVLTTGAIVLHSSLSHEMLHGHPFKNRHLNAALVFPALCIAIPYMRFRDTHLAHHVDSQLTDPYDDPESNFLDPEVWHTLGNFQRAALRFNNTLAGRMLIGPLIGQWSFMRSDFALIRAGDKRVLLGWLWHIPAMILPLWWIGAVSHMPIWAYLLCVYVALSVLKIRTYLEHRAHEIACGRTVVIEDRGLLAFLFLNNNFHSVHHKHPGTAWYDLPAIYAARKEQFLRMNDGYLYRSYRDVFKNHFFKAKDPVPHPLWSKES